LIDFYVNLYLELWIEDLTSIGYEDVPTIKPSADPLYPCVEHDALVGVYFNPSVTQNITNVSVHADSFEIS